MEFELEIFGTVVSLLVLGMLCVCGIDIRNYFRKNTIISGRQLTLRVIGGIFIMALLVKILYGIYWIDPVNQGSDYFIKYWSECTLLAFVCFCFASVDMYITMRLRKQAVDSNQRIGAKLNDIYRMYAPRDSVIRDQ